MLEGDVENVKRVSVARLSDRSAVPGLSHDFRLLRLLLEKIIIEGYADSPWAVPENSR